MSVAANLPGQVNAAKGEGRARDLNRLEMAAAIVPRLVPIAEGLGCTVAQLAVVRALSLRAC